MPRNNQYSSSNSPKRQPNSLKLPSDSPRKRSPPRRTENQPSDTNKVYISGMPGGFTQNEVRQLCRKFGKIIDILVVDKQTFSYAFVQFQQLPQAQQAIRQICGVLINNKSLKCQLAKPRLPRKDFGRGEGQRGSRGKLCFKCGKQGHIARFCQNAQEENGNGHKFKRSNGDREGSRKQGRNGRRDRDNSESSPKKQRNRKRSSSSSSSEKKRHKKRERSDSRSVRKHKKTDNPHRKRKESSSSSRDKRKSRKHKRSRSAELRKGKKRQASSSSS